MTVRVDCLASADALAKLEPEWKALASAAGEGNPFLTFEWAAAWWECFGAGAEPRLLCARDAASGRLLGLAPLVLRRRPGRRVPVFHELSLLGGGAAGADHLDVLVSAPTAEPVRVALLEAVEGLPRDVLRLEGVGTDSDSAVLRRAIDEAPGVWLRERPCPYTPLPRSWEELEAHLPAKLRYNLRSRAQRLERELGERVVAATVSEPEELDRALEALFSLHGQVRAAHGERGVFASPSGRAFHGRLARDFLARGWLRLHLLRAGQRVVAASYCFRSGDRVSFFQTGYDRALARYGVGAAIVVHSIREAIAEGAREFDFLRGDEPYKLAFARYVRNDLRAWIPTTARGRAAIAGYRFARAARARWRGAAARPR